MNIERAPRLIFAGTTSNAATVLKALVDAGHDLVRVITRLDAPVGRKAILTPSPVAVMADSLGLPVLKSNRLSSDETDEIAASGAELGIVVAYGSLLKKAALEALPLGWLNLHFSLLPSFRGAAPVQRAILAGETQSGLTIFKLDEGMDTGPIAASANLHIEPNENSGQLLDRLTQLGSATLLELLTHRPFQLQLVQQPDSGLSWAPKITRADARLLVDRDDSETLARIVRAMNPEPMAWLTVRGEPMRIMAATPGPNVLGEVGRIFRSESGVFVHCAQGTTLRLLQVQPAGKKPMPAESWLNGVQNPDEVILS